LAPSIKSLLAGDTMKQLKKDYLQDVLESHKMSNIEGLIEKYQIRRSQIKEFLEKRYITNIYAPINSGSFAKHTAINSKFDLDLAVPFKRSSFTTISEMFDDVYECLNEEFSNIANIRKQKVSIGIEFIHDSENDIVSLDIVPGRELNIDQYAINKNINLYVNSRFGEISEKTYIQTNIQAQIDHIKAKENERRIIRLLKIWKSSNNESYKSFLFELIVIRAFKDESISGNLWYQLKTVMEYIEKNVAKSGFTLNDPGNSNNNVMLTLDQNDKDILSHKMNVIIKNIEDLTQNIKIYFPINEKFKPTVEDSTGYGVKGTVLAPSIPPRNERFGI
jgi:hypothetical protein